MSKLNGIIISGKVYESVEGRIDTNQCLDCELTDLCKECTLGDLCYKFGANVYFRYSQELTDKLNGYE